jgi:glutaredoxin 3
MARRKKIEVFSTGCRLCQEAIAAVRLIVGADHDVEVLDMRKAHVAAQAQRYGIHSVPSVVVNDHLLAGRGVDEAILRSALA